MSNAKTNKTILLLVLAFFLTVISFFSLINLNNKAIAPHGYKKVYLLNKDIDENQKITQLDYRIVKMNKEDTLNNSVPVTQNIDNKYALRKLYKNEQLTENNVSSISAAPKITNPVTYCLKFSDIGDTVGGTLREGDRVNIIYTEKDNLNNIIGTDYILKNVYIKSVLDSTGIEIKKDNTTTAAMALNLLLSDTDAKKLDNAINKGKVKAVKVIDNATNAD